MNDNLYSLLMVLVMSGVVIFLRAVPFIILKGNNPHPIITYLGKYLPYAIMGMLVVYCLRTTDITSSPYGLRELIAVLVTAGLQIWRKQSLLSIVCGTAVYMFLMHIQF